jgi:general secretion pathway protein N
MNLLKKALARENRMLLMAGGGAFFFAAVAGAPSSLAASILEANAPLLEIGASTGTLWRGEFANVTYNSIDLGRIGYRLAPVRLITGRLAADMTSADGALTGKGGVSLTPSGFELKEVSAQFNLGAIRKYTFFGARYQGVATLSAKSLSLSKRGCKAEEARLSTTMLDGLARQWSGGALPLQGAFECKDGNLFLSLSGRSNDGAMRLETAVAPDLSYTMVFTAEPKRAEVGAALRQFGFEGDNAQLSLRAVGKLKGLST